MHDIVVMSDLHMGRGKNPDTGRFHSLEAFFYDDDFARFCRWLCSQAASRELPFKLVFNGDVFDLLRIEPEPLDAATPRERRFGATLGPEQAAQVVSQILAGHPRFVEGVATVLLAGHQVVFLPGNHDVELQWAPVQDAVRAAVLNSVLARGGEARVAEGLLRFEPWFHHEAGRVWIEHGSQYDPECSFKSWLRGGLTQVEVSVDEAEQDFPLGNFFQRYLYNAFGGITFIVPSTRANARYMKWLLFNQPRTLFRVGVSHLPFAFQLLRRMVQKDGPARDAMRRTHQAELDELATSSGLSERLRTVEGFKNVNAVSEAVRAIVRQTVVAVASVMAVAFFGAGLWFAGFHAINQLGAGFGLKALLFLALNFFFIVAAASGLAYALLRQPGPESAPPLRRAAARIAEQLDVAVVSFGHTHDESVSPLHYGGKRAWYFNTGTWIAVFSHDVLIPRERVQFTFLRIRGNEGELLHWSPGRGEPQPVILLDEDDGAAAATAPAAA